MKNTPWGPSQGQNKIGEGVTSYYTAGHGGIELSPERWAELRAEIPTFQSWAGEYWLEEDCDWAAAAVLWPELFSALSVYNAVRTCQGRSGKDIPDSFWQGRGKKAAEIAYKYEQSLTGKWECGASGSPPAGSPQGSTWCFLRRGDETKSVVFAPGYPAAQFYTDEEIQKWEVSTQKASADC